MFQPRPVRPVWEGLCTTKTKTIDPYLALIKDPICVECGQTCTSIRDQDDDGLCFRCETNRHPERFYACCLCRMPRRTIGTCVRCAEWLSNTFLQRISSSSIDTWLREAADVMRPGWFVHVDECPSFDWCVTNRYPAIRHCPGFYFGHRRWRSMDHLPIVVGRLSYDDDSEPCVCYDVSPFAPPSPQY